MRGRFSAGGPASSLPVSLPRDGMISVREGVVVVLAFSAYFALYFAPATFAGRLLAPGDGLVYYVPALLSRWGLWNHDLYGGHPAFADAQALVLSPLRVFGNAYNAAVIAVYVLAACGAYALARALTGLRGAGALAGLVYASGGAMVAHLGHLTIVYSAAWMPWIVFAIARARDRDSPWPPAVGAAAIALCALGGHPQILVYALALAVPYALFSILAVGREARRDCLIRYAVLFGAGVAVACIQLVPLAELGSWSLRDRLSFADFTSYALTPRDLLLFVFPRILGSYPGFDFAYFGHWNLTELASYAGIATLLLALAALSARSRETEVLFWAGIAAMAVVYALGRSTPLAQLAFHVPPINQFRAPARAAFVTALALAVLAAFGYRAIVAGRLSGSLRRRRFWLRCAALLALALAASFAAYPGITAAAAAKGSALPGWFGNPAVLAGLAAMAVSVGAVYWLSRGGTNALGLLLVVLVVDLGTFGWYYEWREGPAKAQATIDPAWQRFAEDVRSAQSRVLFIDGAIPANVPARPNLNLLYGLPSASGYGPLVLRAYSEVVGVEPTGAIASLQGLRRRLQLTGTAWLVGGAESRRAMHLGGDCSPQPGMLEASVRLIASAPATHLEVVSHLGCSVGVAQDAQVLAIAASGPSGTGGEVTLRAGRETAEWAIDRPDVGAAIAHRRPAESETFPAGEFNGRWFRTSLPLRADGSAEEINAVALRWLQPPGPGITLRSLELVDARSGARRRIGADELLWGAELRQADARPLPGAAWVRRVDGVGAPAWLAAHAVPLARAVALAAIRSGRLPDGRAYDPYATVLLPADAKVPSGASAPADAGEARVVLRRDGTVTLEVQSLVDAYLVLAESFYPGWKATVDGNAADVLEANVAFQAVAVPAGRHTVVFSFVPTSLLLGFGAAIAGLALLVAHLVSAARNRRLRRLADRSPDASANLQPTSS